MIDLFGGEVIHTDPPINPMPSQTFKIAPGTLVSIKSADDTNQPWKAYTTRKEAIGERVAGSSGAIVIRVGAWLILTKWYKATKIES